jgi:septal ring factor EnvC (AmiA/AmiB activator)
MTGILYAITEIAILMVAATIVGFLLGRVTKRASTGANGQKGDLVSIQAALQELEAERDDLRGQLHDAKERTRLLAAEVTRDEVSQDFAAAKREWEQKFADAEALADRLRATIAERDGRIAALMAGEAPPDEPARGSVGFSHSAGSFAETRIIFDQDNE